MQSTKMTRAEQLAVISLSSIMSLRMIGLFMVLPVFSLYAHQLSHATPTLIGIALGIYGLSQALLQIPFGSLSDYFGRKPIIFIGLLIFVAGSLLAGFAHSIFFMIIGRALQGAGAVGSTLLAYITDLTRETQRSKAMAVMGIMIGFSFSLAMLIGPLLSKYMAIHYLFFLAALLGLLGIVVLLTTVPDSATIPMPCHKKSNINFHSLMHLLIHPELIKLNLGIFILHAIFTASFIVIPITLSQQGFKANQQWELYLPALLTAFLLSLLCIHFAEKKQQIKFYFLTGIVTMVFAEIILWQSHHFFVFGLAICLFFTGFSLLEAFLPSLISRTAPTGHKGSALGIYSCWQFFGIFLGGVMGGWLYGQYHFAGVYFFCIILGVFWLMLAFLMQPPRYVINHLPLNIT